VLGNGQRLDGGAMFGNCPRALWSRWCPPDEENRIELACRALLVREPGGRHVLLETGIGAFFPPPLRERYGVTSAQHELLAGLASLGVRPEDVDVVVLSHLHFDHAGGALTAWHEGASPALAFPRARWVVSAEGWARARRPHARDRASFIPELPALLEASGRLEVVTGDRSTSLGPSWELRTSEGHTPGLLHTTVPAADGPITFVSDLIPGTPWVHVPITMGYDRWPERLIEEKEALLAREAERGGRLFYTHDPAVACSGVARDERGRWQATSPRATMP
jgi:glyoxylase-like metal-dependent hydrolase (beta-lactamase superfamily II)